jgi:hypothetical protein
MNDKDIRMRVSGATGGTLIGAPAGPPHGRRIMEV